MSELRLMKGNEALAEAAIRAELMLILVIQLHHNQKLLNI